MKEYRYINVHGTILYAEGHEVTRHKHGGEKMTMFRTEVMKQEYPAHWTRTEETVPADWKKRLNAESKNAYIAGFYAAVALLTGGVQ